MSDDISLKIGVDGAPLLKQFQDLRNELAGLRDENAQLNKQLQETASANVASEKEITDLIGNHTKQLDNQKQVYRDLKKYIDEQAAAGGKAFDSKVLEGYNKELKKSGDLISGITAAGKKGLLSPDEVKKLSAALANTNDEFEALNVILDVTKKKLAGLDPGSEEFKQLSAEVQSVEAMLSVFNETSTATTEKQKSLRQTLRENTQALAEMKEKGLENTEEFRQLKAATGELYDTLSDTKEEIRQMGSDTRGLDHVLRTAQLITGSFQIAQGAAAIFGTDNEHLQEALLKVNAAMSILNGLQAIQTELTKKDSVARTGLIAIQKFWTASINETNIALAALRIALLATGIGAAVVALGAIAQAMGLFGEKTSEATEELERQNAALEANKNFLDAEVTGYKKQSEVIISQLEAEGATSKQIREQKVKDIEGEIEIRKELYDKSVENLNKYAEVEKKIRSGKATDEEAKAYNDALKKMTDASDAFHNAEADRDILLNNNKKALRDENEKAEKDAQEKAKQRGREQKQLNDEIVRFIKQAELEKAAAIQDENDRERALNLAAFENEITDLDQSYKKILSSQQLSEEQRIALKKAYEDRRNDISAKYAAKAVEIDKKQLDEQKKVIDDANKAIISLQETGKQRELDEIDLRYQEITDRIKKGGKLTAETEKEIETARNRERNAVTLKYGVEELDNQEKIEVAKIELLKSDKFSPALLEELKQKKVLEVQLKYAKIRLQALEAAGGKENEVAIAQTKALIAKLQLEIKATDTKESPVAKFLGITDDQIKAALSSAEQTVDSILDILASGLQRKVDLKQKEIDELNKKIDESSSSLDKELELQKKGYANNVSAKQKELDALKAQRDKDIQQQQEYQKKLQQIETAKQIAAFATAAANLVVTASKIVESLTEDFGWVGALAGVAEAAAVVAEFFALRNQIKANQSLGDGGEVGGKSHSQGGNKYVSMDGNDRHIVEIERGEYVVKRDAYNKNQELVRAINENPDAFSDWKIGPGGRMIAPAEYSFNEVAGAKVRRNHETVSRHNTGTKDSNSEYLQSIAYTNAKMLEKEDEKVEIHEYPDRTIEKKGNMTRIIYK